MDVSWSHDLEVVIGWCGVLDPAMHEPEVADWFHDWSPQEPTVFVEDVTKERRQALASISTNDATPAERAHQAEALAVEVNRTWAQARSVVAFAKENRSECSCEP